MNNRYAVQDIRNYLTKVLKALEEKMEIDGTSGYMDEVEILEPLIDKIKDKIKEIEVEFVQGVVLNYYNIRELGLHDKQILEAIKEYDYYIDSKLYRWENERNENKHIFQMVLDSRDLHNEVE